MRFKIKDKWESKVDLDGILYATQRMEEMLMIYTSHLYKNPVHNTFTLAYEYMYVSKSVSSSKINEAHLNNILDEFIDSLQSDIVIKANFTHEEVKSIIDKLNSASTQDKVKIIHYFIHLASKYPFWSANILKESIRKPKEKKNIEKALRAYIPTIVYRYYHPQYIYKELNKHFSKNISSYSEFDQFLDKFNFKENKYTVYFIVNDKINKFKTILENRLEFSFIKDDICNEIKYDKNKKICIHIDELAFDPNGAAHNAYERYNLFMRYYCFLGNRDREWCDDKCFVYDSNNDMFKIHFGPDQYFYSRDYDDITLGRSSDKTITNLIGRAGQSDFFKLDKIIKTHNSAICSLDINTAFLNLWSILEIVCIDEFRGEKSKIQQVIDNILPVLKKNYVNDIISELHDYLKANLTRDEYSIIIGNIDENGSDEFKILCLISLDKYDNLRKKSYHMLHQFPLIRSRISQLNENVFKKKKKLINEFNRYEKRITWHIQRLYRVRNFIIHSGDSYENMVSLVEHLHSYVDEVVLYLINRMTREDSLGTISNVLLDSKIFIENITNKFHNLDEEPEPSELKLLLYR